MQRTAEGHITRIANFLSRKGNEAARIKYEKSALRLLELGQKDHVDSYSAIEENRNYDTRLFRESIFGFIQKRYHIVPHLYKKISREGKTTWYEESSRKSREEPVGEKLCEIRRGESMQCIFLTPENGYESDFHVNISTLRRLHLDKRLAREIDNLTGSYIDHLSTCHTRKFLENLRDDYFPPTKNAQTKETNRKYALLFIDIDEFKKINDKQGYDAGDTALNQVGRILQESCRDIDKAARWGGDEFVVFLDISDATDQEGAVQKYRERILDRLEAMNRLHVDARGKPKNPLKISIGQSLWEAGKTYADAKGEAEAEMKAGKSPLGGFRRHTENIKSMFKDRRNIEFIDIFTHELVEILSELPLKTMEKIHTLLGEALKKRKIEGGEESK